MLSFYLIFRCELFAEKVSLGQTDVSAFLKLPRLEKLFVNNVRFFTADSVKKIKSVKFDKLTILHIELDKNNPLDLSGMCDAVSKMPALKYLLIHGMPEEQTTDFTCRVTKNQVLNRDIVVIPDISSKFKSIRVFKDADTYLRDESLRLWLHAERNNYCDQVYKFFRSLENCTVVVDDRHFGDLKGGFLFYRSDDLFEICSCHYSDDEESD